MRKFAVLVSLLALAALSGCASTSSVTTVKADVAAVKAIVEAPATGNAALGVRVGALEAWKGAPLAPAVEPAPVTPAVEPVSPSAQAPAGSPAPVVPKDVIAKEKTVTWTESLIRLFIGIVIGVVATLLFGALDESLTLKAQAEELSIFEAILAAIAKVWTKIFGKKAATATTTVTSTTASAAPVAPAAPAK
jgi:hypothetical protein